MTHFELIHDEHLEQVDGSGTIMYTLFFFARGVYEYSKTQAAADRQNDAWAGGKF